MINWGEVPAGAVLPFPFATYDANGASVTLTGLAVTDIEVYKGTSMTQRASDNGYALLDTDGIDIDGVTGFHGFSIDTGDNSDAGFYAVGSFYTVLVSAVTIASQTVSFIAGTFRIKEAETVAGRVEARVASVANDAITAAAIAADAIGSSELAASAVTEIQTGLATATDLATVDTVVDAIKAKTDNLPSDPADASVIAGRFDTVDAAIATVDGNVDAILVDTAEIGAAGAGLTALASAADLATVDANVDAILVDTGTDIPATLATIAGYIDTEVGAIKAKTDNLPSDPADQSLIIAATDALATAITGLTAPDNAGIAAIKAKTDNLPAAPAATADIPSAATIAAAVWAAVIDGTRSAAQLTRGFAAALLGKSSGHQNGAPAFRDIDDSKDVVSGVVDEDGNRTSVTLDLS